jgi:hypothetical protein
MPTSNGWRALKREIATLREHFLPDPFHPLGVYLNSTRAQAHTRAFIVLSHAEIESYLEEWAKDIARASEVVWTSSRRITEPLSFLLATLAERIEVPITLVGPKGKDSPQRLVEASLKLFQKYYKQIKDNNGIKERNVLALFAPLGVPAAALGLTLLPNLDNLGVLRGTHAHQSAKAVQTVLDPETEYKRVNELLDELVALDEWLVKYKRRIR